MKTLILSLLMLPWAFISNAQNVPIPDTAFLHALIDLGVDTNEDSLISYAECEGITSLDVSSQNISDMTGIEAFISLDTLFCQNNNLTSLNMSSNTVLTFLVCMSNELVSLDVSNNPGLTSIVCDHNQLTRLDISHNTVLEFLTCYNNQLTSLDVSRNTVLEQLYCDHNQLTYLDVSHNAVLKSLSCGSTLITNLDLSRNDAIEVIDLSDIPTLYDVCVWVLPFPPEGIQVITTGSPHINFMTDCSVTDVDGNVYRIVNIGTQVWMAENLKVTHYRNGIPIPNVTGNTAWANLSTGARCYYNNDSAAFDSIYGALYNFYVVQAPDNICPLGWHVSTDPEWTALEAFLGGTDIAGGKMKETGTAHWASPNADATNSCGFSGLPGGALGPNYTFIALGENGIWWTSSEYATDPSWIWSTYLYYLNAGVDHNPIPKTFGLSIRCVKDMGTGIGDIRYTEQITLYPNPSNRSITVEGAGRQPFQLAVYSMSGEVVLQREANNASIEIDIVDLPQGIYIVKITGTSWTVQQKLIKE